jgi:hypothetical protein
MVMPKAGLKMSGRGPVSVLMGPPKAITVTFVIGVSGGNP